MEDILRGNLIDNQPASQISASKRNKLRFLIPLALVLTAALIACGSNPGDLAPDFSISMYQGQDVAGGQEINFRDLLGGRPIVLNFWAGLCPPCRAEMPDLQACNDKFEDRALLLGIDIGQFTGLGTPRDAQSLLDELGVTYPSGFTNDGNIIQDYKVLGMPTTVFIDAQGEIFNRWTGALNGEVLEEKTLEMLNQ